jgi:hypothetical protein
MTRTLASLAVLTTLGVGLALSHTASAQSRPNDRQYCDALVDKYRAYVSDPSRGHSARSPDVEYEVAISKCRSGDTAAGIPPLEKALRGAKVDLPSRG